MASSRSPSRVAARPGPARRAHLGRRARWRRGSAGGPARTGVPAAEITRHAIEREERRKFDRSHPQAHLQVGGLREREGHHVALFLRGADGREHEPLVALGLEATTGRERVGRGVRDREQLGIAARPRRARGQPPALEQLDGVSRRLSAVGAGRSRVRGPDQSSAASRIQTAQARGTALPSAGQRARGGRAPARRPEAAGQQEVFDRLGRGLRTCRDRRREQRRAEDDETTAGSRTRRAPDVSCGAGTTSGTPDAGHAPGSSGRGRTNGRDGHLDERAGHHEARLHDGAGGRGIAEHLAPHFVHRGSSPHR